MINQSFKLVIIGMLFLISGCTVEDASKSSALEKDILIVDHEDLDESDDLFLLEESHQLWDGANFSFVQGFQPSENYKAYETITDVEEYLYIENHDNNNLTGTLIFENGTENDAVVIAIFLQGNDSATVTIDEKEWFNGVNVTIPQKKRLEIDLTIEWNKEGMEELSVILLRQDNHDYKELAYNQEILRFYVDTGESIEDKLLQSHIEKKEIEQDGANLYPSFELVKNSNSLDGYKLAPLAYPDSFDILLIDKEGRSKHLKSINVSPLEHVNYSFTDDEQSFIKESDYIIFLNNRGSNIMADVRTIFENPHQLFTTYSTIYNLN